MTISHNNRLLALDAFRGFTVIGMVIVNNPGSWDHVYPPLLHAVWNGLTITDLIFPFFLFSMGFSIALVFEKKISANFSKIKLLKKIVGRTLKIFALGLILNSLWEFKIHEIRVTGVLQRIALVYLVCSLIYLYIKPRTQIFLGSLVLLAYWLIMSYLPTPGYGKPMLEPGVNLAAWFDTLFLPGKMWHGTWDSESILSTFPACISGLIGMLAAKLYLQQSTRETKILNLFVLGVFLFVAGQLWSYIFPINKNLWTSSFVLVTSGLALLLFALTTYMIDYKGYTRWALLGVAFGVNAITFYVLSDVLNAVFYGIHIDPGNPLNVAFLNFAASKGISLNFASLAFAVFFCIINFIPAYFMYKKRIFIRL